MLDNARRDELSADFRGASCGKLCDAGFAVKRGSQLLLDAEGSGMRGEVEFLLQTKSAEVVPVEVKSGGM